MRKRRLSGLQNLILVFRELLFRELLPLGLEVEDAIRVPRVLPAIQAVLGTLGTEVQLPLNVVPSPSLEVLSARVASVVSVDAWQTVHPVNDVSSPFMTSALRARIIFARSAPTTPPGRITWVVIERSRLL